MNSPMTDEDYAQWRDLPHHVVINNFEWAYSAKSDLPKPPRLLDYDDLIGEANLGLMNAWANWDPEKDASFKTYAYLAIFRWVHKFVYQNISPVSTPQAWPRTLRKKSEDHPMNDLIRAAVWDTRFFSEMRSFSINQPSFKDEKSSDPSYNVEKEEYYDFVVSVLKECITKEEFKILVDHYCEGKTRQELAKKYKYHKNTVGKMLSRIRKKCQEALIARGLDDV